MRESGSGVEQADKAGGVWIAIREAMPLLNVDNLRARAVAPQDDITGENVGRQTRNAAQLK